MQSSQISNLYIITLVVMWVKKSSGMDKIILKVRGLKEWEENVYLEQLQKGVGGKYEKIVEDDGLITEIEWFLRSVVSDSYEHVIAKKAKTMKTVKFFLEDTDENMMYVLDMGLNNSSMSILNALDSVQEFGEIGIRFYSYRKDWEIKKWVVVMNNGEKLSWKHDYQTVIKPLLKEDGKGNLDKTGLHNFFIDISNDLKERVKKNDKAEIAEVDKVIDNQEEFDF